MGSIGHSLDIFGGLFTNHLTLAALTFCGMVLTVLGAFYLIDALQLPPKIGRTGMPILPVFDETFIVRGIPWQAVRRHGIVSRVFVGVVSGVVGAVAFAVVIGLGYRHGTVGALIGVAMGLGLGLAVALRSAVHWLTRRAGLSFFFTFIRAIVSTVSALAGQAILFLLTALLFFVGFVLFVTIWLVLLPWMLFAWVVRRIRKQPSHTAALFAPFAFPRILRTSIAKERASGEWKDTTNTAASARFSRWAIRQLPKLQKFALGVVIGNLYGIAGQPLITSALSATKSLWFLLGALVLFGFAVERIYEVIVESLFFLDISRFADQGPSTLNGLRVGLVTGLSLGTIVGLVTNGSGLSGSIGNLISNLTPENAAVVMTVGAFALLIWLVPNMVGTFATWFANWITDRVRNFGIGTGVGGVMLLLTGTLLQLVQYAIAGR